MATGYGTNRTGAIDKTLPTPKRIPPAMNNGAMRMFSERFDLSLANVKKVVADNNVICDLPAGFVPSSIRVSSTVSLTTSTLAFGITGTTGKYGTAAAYGTTPEVVKEYLLTSRRGVALTADERLIMTVAVADLPGTGTIVVEVEGSMAG
jgi:hypothetical protein